MAGCRRGGDATTAWFEVAALPELLDLQLPLVIPAQVSITNGVMYLSAVIPNLLPGN
jgi:hypothetical protein